MQHAPMNKLREYLDTNRISDAAFGVRIGKHRSTVGRIARDEVSVDRETALAIYRETDGAVTPNDLFGIQPEALTEDGAAETDSASSERKVA